MDDVAFAMNTHQREYATTWLPDRQGLVPDSLHRVAEGGSGRTVATHAFKAGFEIGAKPIDESVVKAVLLLRINKLEPLLP